MSVRSGKGHDELETFHDMVIVAELDWSKNILNQIIGRVLRGDREEVDALYILTEYGSDPSMIEVLGIKEEQSVGIQDLKTLDEAADQALGSSTAGQERIKAMARQWLENNGGAPDPVPSPSLEELAQLIQSLLPGAAACIKMYLFVVA